MNAKEELISFCVNIVDLAGIKCARITYKKKRIYLKINYSKEDWQKFMNELDFEYENSYAQEELYGYVWLCDGSWLERVGEYDASDRWGHKVIPPIPKYLQIDKKKD